MTKSKSFPWQKAAAIAGVGGFLLLILPSLLGGKKEGEGSESGGFQIPDFFPQSAGAAAVPPGATNYNISFPDFPGFPSSTSGYNQAEATKKSIAIANIGTGGVPPSLYSTQVSPAMMTVDKSLPGFKAAATPRSSGGSSTGNMGITKKAAVISTANVSPAMMKVNTSAPGFKKATVSKSRM